MVASSSHQPFFSRSNIRSLIVILSLVLAARWSIASPYEVPTPSMEPTIKVGDRLIGNHLAYGLRVPFTSWTAVQWGVPQRGDIVIFRSQTEPGINLVKRVVAVGAPCRSATSTDARPVFFRSAYIPEGTWLPQLRLARTGQPLDSRSESILQ